MPTTADTFVNGKVDVTVADLESGEEVVKQIPYAEMNLGASIAMQDLEVKSIYTTNNGGSSDGAMTLTCESNGVTVIIRTTVLRNADGSIITEDAYLGQTISIRGVVDAYDGEYQIKILSANDIEIH